MLIIFASFLKLKELASIPPASSWRLS